MNTGNTDHLIRRSRNTGVSKMNTPSMRKAAGDLIRKIEEKRKANTGVIDVKEVSQSTSE